MIMIMAMAKPFATTNHENPRTCKGRDFNAKIDIMTIVCF